MAFAKWQSYETPYVIDSRADFAWYSNEDIGFVATLATGTNDTFEYAMPYPSSVDLFEETIVLYKSDFMWLNEALVDIDATEIQRMLDVYASMLQVEFDTTAFQGTAIDAEDEALKTKFAGPMGFGNNKVVKSSATDESGMLENEVTNLMQYMPFSRGIDLITPIYYTLVNKSISISALAVLAPADYSTFEQTAQRIWHRKRNLTSAERSFRNISIRFQLIDT